MCLAHVIHFECLFQVKRYFLYEGSNGPVNEIWQQVSLKAPLIKLLTNRKRRMVERGANETVIFEGLEVHPFKKMIYIFGLTRSYTCMSLV
jgi:hypothetical protein